MHISSLCPGITFISHYNKMIPEETLVEVLLSCRFFMDLPFDIFILILRKVISRSWLTIFNVSRYSVPFKTSSYQPYFSRISVDGVHVVLRRDDDLFISPGFSRRLSQRHTTVVFAHGAKVPNWLYMIKNKENCLVL